MSESDEAPGALKHGARIYYYEDGVILVKQTVQRLPKGPYVIDAHRERHVDPGDDAVLVEAVRAAGRGEL